MKRRHGADCCYFWYQKRRRSYAIHILWDHKTIVSEERFSERFFTRMGLTPVNGGRKRFPRFLFHEQHEPYIGAIMMGAHPMDVVRRYLEDYPPKGEQ